MDETRVENLYLGHATAYGYAKAKGYEGTEEEFAQLCADLGIDIEQLENMTVIINMLEPDADPSGTYSDGVLTLNLPRGVKGDTGESAYEYAVAGGYTGTEEEFQQLCADLGIEVDHLENMTVVVNMVAPSVQPSATYVDGTLTINIQSATAEQVSTATDAWLAQNITNPSNPPLDRSLTLANAAAPADLTGELKSAFNTVIYTNETSTAWEDGNYDAGTGKTKTSEVMSRLTEFVGVSNGVHGFFSTEDYRFGIYAWDSTTGEYVGCLRQNGNISKTGTVWYRSGLEEFSFLDYPSYNFKVAVTKPNSERPTSAELQNIKFKTSNIATDKTLTITDRPADAKAVGDKFTDVTDNIIGKVTEDLTDMFKVGYITTSAAIGTDITSEIANPSSYDGYNYLLYQCKKGDKFTITGRGAGDPRLWCFTDSSCKILKHSASNANETNHVEYANENGYFIANVNKNDPYRIVLETSPINIAETIAEVSAMIYPKSNTVKTIAHRGDDILAPQCTAPAYIIAKKRGIDIGENDLALSADNAYVMWHDETLARLGTNLVDISGYYLYTDGTDFYYYDSENTTLYTFDDGEYIESAVDVGTLTQCAGADYSVSTLNLEILKRIDFGRYKGAQFIGTQILTFEEWVLLCKQIGMELYVDKKINYTDSIASDLVGIVRKYGMLDQTTWLCGTQASNIRTYDPNARCGTIYAPTAENVQTFAPYKTGRGFFFQPNAENATLAMANLAHDNGFDFGTYYVDFGNSPASSVFNVIKSSIAIGAQMITTDHYRVEDAFADVFDAYGIT